MERAAGIEEKYFQSAMSFLYVSPFSCCSLVCVLSCCLTSCFLFYKKVSKHFPFFISEHVAAVWGMLYRLELWYVVSCVTGPSLTVKLALVRCKQCCNTVFA